MSYPIALLGDIWQFECTIIFKGTLKRECTVRILILQQFVNCSCKNNQPMYDTKTDCSIDINCGDTQNLAVRKFIYKKVENKYPQSEFQIRI